MQKPRTEYFTARKWSVLLLTVLLVLALTACGNQAAQTPTESAEPMQAQTVETKMPEETPAQSEEASAEPEATATLVPNQESSAAQRAGETTSEGNESSTLVVYFSATGTTKGVAEKIAALTDADTYEIIAAEPYSDADLNWHDSNSRTTHEQNDKSVRPEIASEPLVLDGHDTIYIGFPIWWGEEPRIMDAFAESYDFTGKTVIPFCTSSSSGIGRSGNNLAELAGSGTWLDGARFGGGVSEADLQTWIDGLK